MLSDNQIMITFEAIRCVFFRQTAITTIENLSAIPKNVDPGLLVFFNHLYTMQERMYLTPDLTYDGAIPCIKSSTGLQLGIWDQQLRIHLIRGVDIDESYIRCIGGLIDIVNGYDIDAPVFNELSQVLNNIRHREDGFMQFDTGHHVAEAIRLFDSYRDWLRTTVLPLGN